jgi:hypothetical protein
MSTTPEEVMVKLSDDGARIFVSEYDDNSIWMSMYRSRANASVVITPEEAKELIAALQTFVDAKVPA